VETPSGRLGGFDREGEAKKWGKSGREGMSVPRGELTQGRVLFHQVTLYDSSDKPGTSCNSEGGNLKEQDLGETERESGQGALA